MFSVITLNSLFLRGSLTNGWQQLQVAEQANDAMVIETTNIRRWKIVKTPEKPCVIVCKKTNNKQMKSLVEGGHSRKDTKSAQWR